jgi:amidase
MNAIDLAFTPALKQAKLISQREISPLELVEVYLERIQRLNPQLGTYFTVCGEQAIADAKIKTEQLVNQSCDFPPFFGVPIAIKDLNPVLNIPCTYGTPALLNHIPNYEDVVIAKIRHAGFTIIGKTATSELGSFPYTETSCFPPSRNPWNLEYTSGGSSGGAAAAVAAGLSPIAQASDGGGSIRGPVACCGVVGIKPSRGRVSCAPAGDRFAGLATNGSIARTVADAASLLDIMSGYVLGDSHWLPEPKVSFFEHSQQKTAKLRIAYSTKIHPIGNADSTCQQAVEKTVQLLGEMGHDIEEKIPDITGLIEPFQIIWQSGVAASGIPPEALQPLNRWLLSKKYTASDYVIAVSQMQIFTRQILSYYADFDVLVLPVYLHRPIQVGEWSHLSPEDTFQNIIQWIAPCPLINATGQPAIALPVGFDHQGLPMSVQLVGKPADEATIIQLAAQLEAVNPWIGKRPNLD